MRNGQLSSVTRSSFGYHVILLEERAPAQVVPNEQLPALLAPVFGGVAFERREARTEPPGVPLEALQVVRHLKRCPSNLPMLNGRSQFEDVRVNFPLL